jgi:hypothetical protein
VSRLTRIPIALALFAAPVLAQVEWTVAPQVPLGVPVPISISNDTAVLYQVGQACPYDVLTPTGQKVYTIDCPSFVPFDVLPFGGVVTFYWDQRDNFGQQVPAGDYLVENDGFPGVQHKLTIGGTKAALANLGVMRIGTGRHLELMAPGSPDLLYFTAAALSTSPGIPTCNGTFPLNPDLLFLLSLDPSAGFQNFFGTLDGGGGSTAPTVKIPGNPNFAGTQVFFAFASLDTTAPFCLVEDISTPLSIVIQG